MTYPLEGDQQEELSEETFEEVYGRLKDANTELVNHFGEDRQFPIILANAQGELLARTLRGITLRKIPAEGRARYLNWLFGQIMEDVIKGEGSIEGAIVVQAVTKKKKASPKKKKAKPKPKGKRRKKK